MLNTLIVGASGYAGAELVSYVNRHPSYDHNRFDRLSAKQ
ncbi:N-acetyl-gamma-glutamyl-phosphate reductase [Citrobacter amalonaticus]|nr:N-acetyl-gamma-glutamyl-phosphate reductase [Citrobacter amalonaticus]